MHDRREGRDESRPYNLLHRKHMLQHSFGSRLLPGNALAGRRCILFDLGDTLWSRGDTQTWAQQEAIANHRAIELLRKHIQSDLLPMLDDFVLGQRVRQTIDRHIRARILRNPNIEPDGPGAVIDTLTDLGIPMIDRELGATIFEALRIRIPESRSLFPDTHSTLRELQRRGYLLGVVTNRIWGGQPFQEDLCVLGLDQYFPPDLMAVSGDLGVRKPNPAIFQHALKARQVSPEEAVMVGDSLSADVLGAQALGIFAIWKPKPEILARISSQKPATSNIHISDPNALGPEIQPEETTEQSPPPGLHRTDDDFMLAQDRSRDYLERYLRGEIQPDLIIEHLSDLLDIFVKAS